MLQIRKGVFETNSSSVHTLIISKDSWYDQPKYSIDKRAYIIKGGYYGRVPQHPMDEIEDKLNYIWTMVSVLWGPQYTAFIDAEGKILKAKDRPIEYRDKERYDRWKNKLQKLFPNTEFVPIEPNDWEKGIDHAEGLREFANIIENCPELLKYFLFVSNSALDVSGDEYFNWAYLLDFPIEELIDFNDHTAIYVKGC